MIRIAFVTILLVFSRPVAYAQSKSTEYTADYQQTALEIYRQIISIRSAAGHGNVPEVANYLADRFRDDGIGDADIHVRYGLDRQTDKRKGKARRPRP